MAPMASWGLWLAAFAQVSVMKGTEGGATLHTAQEKTQIPTGRQGFSQTFPSHTTYSKVNNFSGLGTEHSKRRLAEQGKDVFWFGGIWFFVLLVCSLLL